LSEAKDGEGHAGERSLPLQRHKKGAAFRFFLPPFQTEPASLGFGLVGGGSKPPPYDDILEKLHKTM